MVYTPATSFNQANFSKRLNKKSQLDSLPIVSSVLISKAARIQRMRLRLQSRLDYLTVANLIAFAYQISHTLSELEQMPMHDGYITGEHYGRTYHFTPAIGFILKQNTLYSVFPTYSIFTNPIYRGKQLLLLRKLVRGIKISVGKYWRLERV